MSAISGVYSIRNITNNRCYIGSSVNLQRRFGSHKAQLNKNIHSNPALQNAWNKYGRESFVFEILMLCPVDQLIENEQKFIDITKYLYNMSDRADLPMLGKNHTEETKLKMSRSKKGQKPWNTGLKMSDELCEKLSKAHMGMKRRPFTEVARQNMSEAHKCIPGHPHTEDVKRTMNSAKKGVPLSEEHKMKLSKAKTGVFRGPHSEDRKRKIGESVRATKLMNKTKGEQNV